MFIFIVSDAFLEKILSQFKKFINFIFDLKVISSNKKK